MTFGSDRRGLLAMGAAALLGVRQGVGGQNPAVIPVDQESSFNLIVNLSAARLLKIVIPASVRIRASRLVE